jgi:N-acetylglutamate synthase-like GNAT family acetyltransferase
MRVATSNPDNPAIGEQLTIRRARESDRPALEAIAARTWHGDDYLPQVFDEWLADPDGEFFVASLGADERVVGTAKLTQLGPGEWWLEGMRVHPDLYGQGIGTALQRYGFERAEAIGSGVVRFATEQANGAVHKMAHKLGFTLTAQFLRYHADALPRRDLAEQFKPLGASDLPAARAFLDSSPHYEQVQRTLIGRRWLCYYITDEHLRTWLDQGTVYGWFGRRHDPAQLDGLMITGVFHYRDGSAPELIINYLDAAPGNLAVMAQAVRGFTAHLGYRNVRHMLLVRPERLVAIEQAGWRRPPDNGGKASLFSRSIGTDL